MALYARATKKALKGSDGSGTQAAETTREKLGVHNVRITFYDTLHFPFDLLPFGNFPQLKCACGICTMSNREEDDVTSLPMRVREESTNFWFLTPPYSSPSHKNILPAYFCHFP